VRLFISEDIVGEISQVLNYPKLRKIYEAEGLRHEELIESILKIVRFVRVTKLIKAVSEHPADDKFIECALEAKADHIVSGDKHLLSVGIYRKVKIISVNEFLQVLERR
jgi:putative PIN family toxin of toxin-antitoxin system